MESKEGLFSIGEIARTLGVSVRTLQYYDEQNLLKPLVKEGGRRKYSRENLLRLEQILFLKSVGFSLEEIKDKILDLKTPADFERVFLTQRQVLTEQIKSLNNTVHMLDTALAEAKSDQEIDLDRLIMIMESIKRGNPYTFVMRYFDDEQLHNYAVQLLGSSTGIDYIKELFIRLEQLYEKGIDPAGKEGQELAKLWWDMVNKFTSGDAKLLKLLLYVGKDIQNWPDEAENVKKPIENFLVKAMKIYLGNNNIPVTQVLGQEGLGGE
jgi:Predicted transcriptional regulators